jgi:thiol:disulfide interchange protein DsbD
MLLAGASTVTAKPFWLRGSDSNEQDFLPPDVAFRVAAHVDGRQLNLRWIIADGYYIYRDKIEAEAASPGLVLGRPMLPPGVTLTDEYFGSQQVYFTEVVVSVPFQRSDYGAHPAEIRLTYQGCAKAGLCYPPISKVLYPDPGPTVQTEAAASPHLASMGRRGYASWQAIAIGGGLAAFVLAGLLLRKNRGLQMPSP